MNIKKVVLNNGLRVITVPLKETKSVTIIILVKVGSRYETKELNGTSHFVEHLFFKGTKKRPSALALTKELDGLGAEYNAFTGKDHTGYYIKVNSEKMEIALEILSDMLKNSLFSAEEIDKERKVILEEINMYEDNPLMYIEDLFEQICFKNSSLARLISGPKENITRLTRREILNYKNNFYNQKNIVLGFAGKVTEKMAVNLTKKYFKLPNKTRKSQRIEQFSSDQRQSRIILKYKDTEQVQIAMGFPALKNTDGNLIALYLLNIILGGNMSSRLFTKIREEHGLAYFIKTTINTFEDTGNFFVQAGLDRRRIRQALELIKKELELIVKSGVSEEELKRAKEFLKGKLILKLEESHLLIQWLTEQLLLTKKIKSLEEKLAGIEKVKINDILNVAGKVINFQKLNLAVIGPFKDKKYFKKII
jgi:predicted Zn-dependent peptidase